MRRLLTAVLVAASLLGASACADDKPAPASSPGTAAAPAPSGSTAAKAVCAEFDKVFNGKARTDLATAIGGVLTARAGTDAAKTLAAETKLRDALTALETQITAVGAVAADPAAKAAFDQVAANVRQSGVDLAFLDGVTKLADLEAKLTPVLLAWITPLSRICL